MEREKIFDGPIPEDIKEQNDRVHKYRKEKLLKEEDWLRILQQRQASIPDDEWKYTREREIQDEILDQRVSVEKLKETIRRYEEDPSREFGLSWEEREQLKLKIMKEMNYSESALDSVAKNIEAERERKKSEE